MATSKSMSMILLTVATCLFYYFIYPTPYMYVAKAGVAYRVHRYTGKQDVSGPTGWVSLETLRLQKANSIRDQAAATEQARSELLKAWDTMKFYSNKGSLAEVEANNPSQCKFTLKIDAPVGYFEIDPNGRPTKRLFTGDALIEQEIPAQGDVKLPLVITGYPQEVLDVVKDGEKILQRVSVRLAGGETPDGKRATFSAAPPDRNVDRLFTPYPSQT